MLKKILSNTIVRLILAVLIGLLVGLAVNESVLKAVMIVKQITGQIIFFLVPLIILGFVAPSIARLKSNASKVLLFAFSIAYLSSVGAATFGAVVGYELIPHLHIQTASEDLKDIPPMLFNLEIPPVMSVMSALVLAVMLGLSTAWVKSEEMERLLEVFQNMVLKLVERVLMPVLPLFIAANFCVLSYEGAITKQLPIFLSVLLIVIICHYIWLTLLYVVASIYSRKNSWGVLKYYGPAYLTALGTMSSAATLGTALTCAKKSKILREEVIDVTVPLFANIHLCGSILTEVFFVLTVSQILYGSMPDFTTMLVFIILLFLTCAKKSKILREEVIDVTVPLFANIHLCGSILTEVFFVLTVSQILYGSMPDFTTMLVFIILLGFFAIGAPGVPGGTVLASLGLIIAILGFDEAGTALLLTIFALQDSFGTACNVTGDGALTLITDTFDQGQTEKASTAL